MNAKAIEQSRIRQPTRHDRAMVAYLTRMTTAPIILALLKVIFSPGLITRR